MTDTDHPPGYTGKDLSSLGFFLVTTMDGILIINKPKGMTSHDVISRLRKLYHQKKFGHTGTLDPDATGVLVVLCGKACKINQFLADTDKKYIAKIQLGYSTTTDDIHGDVLDRKPIDENFDFDSVISSFQGPCHQRVPMTSNKKVNGMKLLDYQRKGLPVPEVYQDVMIYAIKPLEDLSFEIACSSGTYVRSICRDFGPLTNNLSCMASLVRTQVGRFTLSQAQDLDDLANGEKPVLYSIRSVLDHLPMIAYPDIYAIYQGKTIHLDTDQDRVCIVENKEPIAIYDRIEEDIFHSKRGLW